MAYVGNASDRRLEYSSGATPSVCSFVMCFRNTGTPTTPSERVFTIGSDGQDGLLFHWHHPSSSFQQSVIHRSSTGTYTSAKFSTSLAADTWYVIGGRYDGTNVTAWLNGTQETSAASLVHNTSGTRKYAVFSDLVSGSVASGTIAFIGAWDVALTDGDMAALGKGFHPKLIRPASLGISVDLLRTIQPAQGGFTITEAGTSTFTDANPRILMPKRKAA